jgi:hypothetical protein
VITPPTVANLTLYEVISSTKNMLEGKYSAHHLELKKKIEKGVAFCFLFYHFSGDFFIKKKVI